MDLARLRQQAQLRHDDNAGQGTFTLPTGDLLALLAVVEAAETWREVREYMRTEALQLRLSSCGDVEALALAAMKWGTPLEAARLDVEAALAALKETP